MSENRIEPQELYCHNCDGYVQFTLDLSVDGKYKLKCPNCGHTHYRFVRDGRITEERWGSSNLPSYSIGVYATTYSTASWSSATTTISGSWAFTTYTYLAGS